MNGLNSTAGHPALRPGFLSAIILLDFFCFVFGVIGNLGVIVFNVFMNHSKTPTTYFVVNLAIADFLVCLTFFPTQIVAFSKMLAGTGLSGDNRMLICKILITCTGTSLALSVANLLAISVDRFVFISRPLKYPMIMTWSRTYLALTAVWILAIINAHLLFLSVNANEHRCVLDLVPMLIFQVSSFYLPIIVLLFLNYKIFKVARNQLRQITNANSLGSYSSSMSVPSPSLPGNPHICRRNRVKQQLKLIKTFVIVIGILLLCISPYGLVTLIEYFVCNFHCVPARLYIFSEFLSCANSVFNPFIYGIRNNEHKHGYRWFLFKLCNKT